MEKRLPLRKLSFSGSEIFHQEVEVKMLSRESTGAIRVASLSETHSKSRNVDELSHVQ